MNSESSGGILIRTPNWLGDLMMSTAFIHQVMELFPESEVDLVVRSGFEELPLPCRGRILSFDKKTQTPGSFGKNLRQYEYQKMFILPPSFSSAWMGFRASIPERIGFSGDFRKILLKPAKKHENPPRQIHLVDEYMELLNPLPGTPIRFPRLEVNEDWLEKQLNFLPQSLPERFICFAPGAVYGPAKQWPLESFRELGEIMTRESDLPVILLGTEADQETAEFIQNQSKGITNLCGKTSLNQLVAILARASLLVSNDSGAMHVMAALQRPQIALFGSSTPRWTAPLNPLAEVIYLDLECSPCFKRQCPFGHLNCLTGISPQQVAEQALKMLEETTSSA
ncbi:MAG: lipopolysaccharide heptosyltransferase II [bacterium]